jgi:hypothetical protein
MSLIGRAMAQAISCRPVTLGARIRSHSCPGEIYFLQRGTGKGHYDCTNVSHSLIHLPPQLAASLIGPVF